jgi:hypothetical protein
VHAIEIAERQYRLHPGRRARVVREMNDVHGLRHAARDRTSHSTSNTSPS